MITLVHPQTINRSLASASHEGSHPAAYWGRRFVVFSVVVWMASAIVGFRVGLAVLTFSAFTAAVIGFRRPTLGLLGLSMLCTLDPIMRNLLLTGGIWRFNTVHYWLLIVMFLSAPFLLRLSDVQSRILQFLVLLMGLQLAITPDLELGAQHLLNIIITFGLLVYFARANLDKQTWYWLGVVNGVVAGTGAPIFFLQQASLPEVNRNLWAFYPLTAILIICLAYQFVDNHRRYQLTLEFLAFTNVAWIFLSASRSRLFLGLICLIFLVASARKRAHFLIPLVCTLVLAFVISIFFTDLQANSLERFNLLFDSESSDNHRTSGRTDLALAGWYIFLDHPLGVGTGGFADTWATLGNYGGVLTFERAIGAEKGAHAAWTKTMAENGIVGITLLVSFVLSFAVIGWRKHDRKLCSLGLLVTVFLSLAFTSTEFQFEGMWFFVAGVMVMFRHAEIVQLLHPPTPEPMSTIVRPKGIRHD